MSTMNDRRGSTTMNFDVDPAGAAFWIALAWVITAWSPWS